MTKLAVIGGSGASLFPGVDTATAAAVTTPWGDISAPLRCWSRGGHEIIFLARHGADGLIAPHRVNYRANIQALRDVGADAVIALNAVGGIANDAAPGRFVIPDQLIDYTWGREHSYYSEAPDALEFIDFTKPYDLNLRNSLLSAAAGLGLDVMTFATYAATQGPRLETAAEIDRLERDGCHVVGMTGMPEAALAREAGLAYASCCFVVNWAAGRSSVAIHAEIETFVQQGVADAARLIDAVLDSL